MINCFADKELERCWGTNQCGHFKDTLRDRLQLTLAVLDAASNLEDVVNTPGCQLLPLSENQKGLYSLVVEGPWHLVFRYEHGAFHDIWLKEYHYEL